MAISPQRPEPVDDPAFAWALGLLALPWLMHAALVLTSSVGLRPLSGPLPAWTIIALSLAGAWALARAARHAGQPPSAASAPEPIPSGIRRLLCALQIGGGVAFAYPLLLAAFLPITAYDAIAYRLPTVAQWLDAGRIAWVASDDPVRNGYPLGVEAVTAIIAAASGRLRFAGMTSYLFVAPAAVSIMWLARVCQVRAVVARAAAACFLLVPMLILNAPSGYVDAAFASACVCLFCSASLCTAAASPWLYLMAGFAAAHVLALKGTGLPFVVLVVGLCGLRALLRRQRPELRALGAFALAASPGLFWPLRNVLNTGNPLYPIRVSVAGREILQGVGSAEQILDVAGNTPPQLASHAPFVRVLLTWLQWRGPALDFDYRLSGLGYTWLCVALPAIGLLAYRLWRAPAERARFAPITFAWLLTAACFVLQPMAWWSRYTLWLWGAGALAIACELEHLLRARRSQLQAVLITGLCLVALGEGAFALAHAHGLWLALARSQQPSAADVGFLQSLDLQHARQAKRWIAPEFWQLELTRDARICRTYWKPGTDNTNLDGVLAQLSPRPTLFILNDEHVRWADTKRAWKQAGCPSLMVFRGSPVLADAQADPEMNVLPARAFDPLYLLQARPKRVP